MRNLPRRPALRLALLLMGLACSQDVTGPAPASPPPPRPQTVPGPASGHWVATGVDFIAALQLVDAVVISTVNGTVAGGATFTGPVILQGQVTMAITGTDSGGRLQLALTSAGIVSAHLVAQLVGDTQMNAILNGSGFANVALTFTHYPNPVGITVSSPRDSVLPPDTVRFTAYALDQSERRFSPPVAWSTSDSTRARVSDSGLVTALRPGPVIVSATFRGVTGQAPFNVLDPVASVVIPPVRAVVPAVFPLTPALLDSAGNAILGRALTWFSVNPGVADISSSGTLSARTLGVATITAIATFDRRQGSTSVTVRTLQPTLLSGGATFTCGIDADSSAACWGDGGVGELGVAMRTTVAAPVFVQGNVRFASLLAGHTHACGLAGDGTAYCWGGNDFGQLGTGTTAPSTVPVAVAGGLRFLTLAVGYDHTCGLIAGGAAYCWGSNLSGEAGTGSTSQSAYTVPVPVVGSRVFRTLTAGNAHTCGLTADSAAYCWGGNDVGALGDSTTTGRAVPAPVTGGLKFVAISAGAYHTCGIAATGTAYCWGNNNSGELGDSLGAQYQLTPVAVDAPGVRFRAIATGFNHTCGLADTGDLWCWGGDDEGQVGPSAGRLPIAVGLRGSSITAGGFHSCAITPGGAYCWGANQLGQLGAGSTALNSAVPLRISGQP